MHYVMDVDAGIELQREVERLVASPDGHVAVQDEESISLLDVKTGDLSEILPDRQGRELVALLNGRRMLAYHEESGLIGFESDGRRFGHADLGDEVELADSNVLGDGETVVMLVAESEGDEMALSTPRFRFVLVAQRFVVVKMEGAWTRWPRVWGVDESRRRLLVATERPDGELVQFDLGTGNRLTDSPWLKTGTGDSIVTGLDIAADGRAVLALYDPGSASTRLIIVEAPGEERKVLVETAGSVPTSNLLWSPDGERILYRVGSGDEHEISVLKVNPTIGKVKPKVLCKADEDADVAWCGPKRVVAVVEDNLVQVFDV